MTTQGVILICSDIKTTCEKFIKNLFDDDVASRQQVQYEKLSRDEGDQVPQSQTMDREMAKELVDIAIGGMEPRSDIKTSKLPGGETFIPPSNIKTTSRSVASETLKELEAGTSSDDDRRELESVVHNNLLVFKDLESAKKSNEKPLFLIHRKWYDDWVNFVTKSGSRPGPIKNFELDQDSNVAWGKSFVAVDGKGWGFLRDLYGFDVEVKFESENGLNYL